MTSNITIHCNGGFGNRFNVLVSGLYLAHVCNLKPIIIWESNNWCGAGFNEIFDSDLPVIDKFDPSKFFAENQTLNIIHENQFHVNIEQYHPMGFEDINSVRGFVDSRQQNVFFYTNLIPRWVDIQYVLKHILTSISFRKEIVNKSQEILDQLPNPFYGIHRRKTDFGKSSDEEYLNFVKNNLDKTFFVCSDDRETEQEFAKLPNVKIYEKTNYVEKYVDGDWNAWIVDSTGNGFNFNVSRNSMSVIEAIVDLIILSKSGIIETNMNSTFLHTAILLQERDKLLG
jgi:hypothetical protein